MNQIKISTLDNSLSFSFPWSWIAREGVVPAVDDLESKAERGTVYGSLVRVRQAEIPGMKLEIVRRLSQKDLLPVWKIIRNTKINLYYFEKYENKFITKEVYIKKPNPPVYKYPKDNVTDNIIYSPFEMLITAYEGL